MKVRCNKFNATDKIKNAAWLTEGKDYSVLCIYYDKDGLFFYRIIGDDGSTPALFESYLFVISSPMIPENWIVKLNNDSGIFELAPKSWLVPDFWGRYFDGDRVAQDVFDEELKKILKCD